MAFVDTNVFVYALDQHEPAKQARALALLADAARGKGEYGRLVCSTQVLGEFFITVTRKRKPPLTNAEARVELSRFAPLAKVAVDRALVFSAIELCERKSISYWDALIVCAAARAGAATLLTEDLNHGEEMLGVRIVNPFSGL